MGNIPEEIAALRRRLAEIEQLAAEQRPDAARSEAAVDAVIRHVSAQGRGAGNASRKTPSKETHR